MKLLVTILVLIGLALNWWYMPLSPLPAHGDGHIIVDTFRNRLHFYSGEGIMVFEVATGREPGATPIGRHKIVRKDPLDPPDTDSRLGTHWLGLGVCGYEDGLKYGIHGTDEPHSIGRHVSGGCIRMRNADVQRLYERVEVGTVVVVRPIPLALRFLARRR